MPDTIEDHLPGQPRWERIAAFSTVAEATDAARLGDEDAMRALAWAVERLAAVRQAALEGQMTALDAELTAMGGDDD